MLVAITIMRINNKVGHLQDWITQVWVKVTGKRFDIENESWLIGPIGNTEIINDKFIQDLAEKEGLEIHQNPKGSGLLENFDELELTVEEKKLINPKVIEFYERTSNYNFEIWSEWCGFFKPFGWLLSIIFSKRLQQLNLPLSSLQSAKGIKSNIIKLVDKINKVTAPQLLEISNEIFDTNKLTTLLFEPEQ